MSNSEEMLTCVYCKKNSFKLNEGSNEHVILSAIGGRKKSRNVCCTECNNRLGAEIDEPFSEELAYFSTNLGITRDRKKTSPTIKCKVEHDGKQYDLKHGGEFSLSKAHVEREVLPDGTIDISLIAGSREQATKILSQILSGVGKSLHDFESIEAKSKKSYLPTVEERFHFGGPVQFRSVAKMLLTYAETVIGPSVLRSTAFDSVIAYIDGKNSNFDRLCLGYCFEVPTEPKVSNINHRAFLFTSSAKKLAIGVLEIFGGIVYSVELSSQWDGPDISTVYAIDPVTSQSKTEQIIAHSIFDNYCLKKPDFAVAKAGIENIVRTFMEKQSDDCISTLISEAIENHMVGKGDIITEEMINNVAREVAEKFVHFTQRLDSEEVIDLKNT